MVARHVNSENGRRTMHFGGQCSFPLIICSGFNISVLWVLLSLLMLWRACKCKMNSTPARRGYPTLSRLHGKMPPRLTGLPYLADRATSLGGLPHLSCKHDQIKMRDYMERRVTPPRRVTSPTWGPPLSCKQALT